MTTQTVNLTSTGAVPSSAPTPALRAGTYLYIAVYSGDRNDKRHTGDVMSLTINMAAPSIRATKVCGDGLYP